jgi:hypothetical protein
MLGLDDNFVRASFNVPITPVLPSDDEEDRYNNICQPLSTSMQFFYLKIVLNFVLHCVAIRL